MAQLLATVLMEGVATSGPRIAEPVGAEGGGFGAVMAAAIGLSGPVLAAPLAVESPAAGNLAWPMVEPIGQLLPEPVRILMVPRMLEDGAPAAERPSGTLAQAGAQQLAETAWDGRVPLPRPRPSKARADAVPGAREAGGVALCVPPSLPGPRMPVLPLVARVPVAEVMRGSRLAPGLPEGNDMPVAVHALVPGQGATDMPVPMVVPVPVWVARLGHSDGDGSVVARPRDFAVPVPTGAQAEAELVGVPMGTAPMARPMATRAASPAAEPRLGPPGTLASAVVAPAGFAAVAEPPRDRAGAEGMLPVRPLAGLETVPLSLSAPPVPPVLVPMSVPVPGPMPDLARAVGPVRVMTPDVGGPVTPAAVDAAPGLRAIISAPMVPLSLAGPASVVARQ